MGSTMLFDVASNWGAPCLTWSVGLYKEEKAGHPVIVTRDDNNRRCIKGCMHD